MTPYLETFSLAGAASQLTSRVLAFKKRADNRGTPGEEQGESLGACLWAGDPDHDQ